MGTILKVDNINVYYGAIHAIKGISFEVNEGEIVTLIGANGAGKSTTLQTISGLLRSRTGSIEFNGENISHVPAHKLVYKGLAQVPEGRRIFLQMSVEENLEMGAFTQKNAGIDADIESVYEQFPRLRERKKQIAGTLSGGEQQMLAMGRALMSHPTPTAHTCSRRERSPSAAPARSLPKATRFARPTSAADRKVYNNRKSVPRNVVRSNYI